MNTPQKRVIVTHHAPDLDAITSVWLLKRFDSKQYADAHVAFVNPGQTLTADEAASLGVDLSNATHVDTGLGMFDHHQPERGNQFVCAASLVFHDHLCHRYPDLRSHQALRTIIDHVTQIDHFQEIYWPDAGDTRYEFMLHSIIHGCEFTDPHNDDSQLHFGMRCLDNVLAQLMQYHKAAEIIKVKGQELMLKHGKGLAIETRNQETIKLAQKQGYQLVATKDTKLGNVRIKARPDADIDLADLAEKIKAADSAASWYLHPSGKMLLNGSSKWNNAVPSSLTLTQVIMLILETYGKK